MTKIKLVRIYEKAQPEGFRILVDRLWPRGMSKSSARLDDWAKDIAPSSNLRKWFNHDENKFDQFKQEYLGELDHNAQMADFVQLVQAELRRQDVLFLYGAKNKEHNQAVVLKEYVAPKL